MTLESQVTSLELSKRLKKLGVKQEGLFWWHTIKREGIGIGAALVFHVMK